MQGLMQLIHTISSLREAIRAQRQLGKRIALVPTMGALHEGHISLVREAQKHADIVVVSIFVNPTQFGPNEDFSKYPRTLEADCALLRGVGASIVYAPSAEEMYGQGGAITKVVVPGISSILCGAFRPGHFDGVATVVTKLFQQALPDVAIFGEKDYQQLTIIRQFTKDLDIPVQIIGIATLREADGLAMSSRNRYLSAEERKNAANLYKILLETRQRLTVIPAQAGIPISSDTVVGEGDSRLRASDDIKTILEEAKAALLAGGFTKIDYVELCDAATLEPLSGLRLPARLLAAAFIGTTRLIDNIEVT